MIYVYIHLKYVFVIHVSGVATELVSVNQIVLFY